MPKNPSDTVKRYSIDAVIKIRLINQCLNIGMTLDSADRIVSRYMDLHDKKEAMGSGDAVKDEEAGNGDEAVNDEEDGLKGFVYTRIGDAGPMAEGEGSMAVREGLPDVGGSLAGSYFYPREDARKLESKIDDLKERLSLIERVVERISDSIGMINSIRHGGDILG